MKVIDNKNVPDILVYMLYEYRDLTLHSTWLERFGCRKGVRDLTIEEFDEMILVAFNFFKEGIK